MALARTRGIIGVVTDRRRLLPGAAHGSQLEAVIAQASAAAAAGADFLQIRERDLSGGALERLVRAVLEETAGSSLNVIVNDRVDVAVCAGAHGVHLPGAGIPPFEVRAIVPSGFLVGQSIHGDEMAAPGVDFAVFGTVFQTISKGPGHLTAGIDALASASRRARAPILAIGGVTEANVEQVAAVCSGIAAIGWFASTDARRLIEAVARARRAFDTITPLI